MTETARAHKRANSRTYLEMSQIWNSSDASKASRYHDRYKSCYKKREKNCVRKGQRPRVRAREAVERRLTGRGGDRWKRRFRGEEFAADKGGKGTARGGGGRLSRR